MKSLPHEVKSLKVHIRQRNLNAIRKFINDHPKINLNAKDKDQRTVLYDVIHTCNENILHYFLTLPNNHFKINDKDSFNMTPLDYLLSLKTFEDIKPCFDLLIKAGAIEKHNNKDNQKIRNEYTGNTYHLNGDLPSWSFISNNNIKLTNDTKSSVSNNNNNNIIALIISYPVLTLLSIISMMNKTNIINQKVFYMNNFEDIKNDLFLVDIMIALLTGLVLCHIYLKSKLDGIKVSIIILCISSIEEQLSIQLGETHCHFDAFLMVTKCSSFNSIIFYIPWMYSCYYIAQIMKFPTNRSKLLFIGLIHPLFCTMYELTGANNQRWWRWGTKVAALNERFYEVPIMAVAFHYFFGLCFAVCFEKISKIKINSLIQIIICILLPPIAATLLLASFTFFIQFGLTNFHLTYALLLGSIAIILYDFSYHQKKNGKVINEVKLKKDWSNHILISIPFLFFTFIFSILLKDLYLSHNIKPYQNVLLCNIVLGYSGLVLVVLNSRAFD